MRSFNKLIVHSFNMFSKNLKDVGSVRQDSISTEDARLTGCVYQREGFNTSNLIKNLKKCHDFMNLTGDKCVSALFT